MKKQVILLWRILQKNLSLLNNKLILVQYFHFYMSILSVLILVNEKNY